MALNLQACAQAALAVHSSQQLCAIAASSQLSLVATQSSGGIRIIDQGSLSLPNNNTSNTTSNSTNGSHQQLISYDFNSTSSSVASQGSFSITDLSWSEVETHRLAISSKSGAISVIDANTQSQWKTSTLLRTGCIPWESLECSRAINRIAWHGSRKEMLAAACHDGTVKLYDSRTLEDNKIVGSLDPHADVARDVQFDPHNEHVVASIFENGCFALWDLRSTSHTLCKVNGHIRHGLSLGWHPFKRNVLATGSMDKTVKIWDMSQIIDQPGGNMRPNTIYSPFSVGRIAWRRCRDRDQIAITSCAERGDIAVWDLQYLEKEQHPICILNGHLDPCLDFDWIDTATTDVGDDKGHNLDVYQHIISIGKDGKLLLQDVRNGFFPSQHMPNSVTAVSSKGHVVLHRGFVDRQETFGLRYDGRTQQGQGSLRDHPNNFGIPSLATRAVEKMVTIESMSGKFGSMNVHAGNDLGKAETPKKVSSGVATSAISGKKSNAKGRSATRGKKGASNTTGNSGNNSNNNNNNNSIVNELGQSNALSNANANGNNNNNNNNIPSNIAGNSSTISHQLSDIHKARTREVLEKETGMVSIGMAMIEDLAEARKIRMMDEENAEGSVFDPAMIKLLAVSYRTGWYDSDVIGACECNRQTAEDAGLRCRAAVWTAAICILKTQKRSLPINPQPSQPPQPPQNAQVACEGSGNVSANSCAPIGVMGLPFVATVVGGLLRELLEGGDCQHFVLLCEVFRVADVLPQILHVANITESRMRDAYLAYLDILNKLELFSCANDIIRHSDDEYISKFGKSNVMFYTSCSQCRKEVLDISINTVSSMNDSSNAKLPWCVKCSHCVSLCSLCERPVRGLYMICPICSHGGHRDCLRQWFSSQSSCPAGCNHDCTEYNCCEELFTTDESGNIGNNAVSSVHATTSKLTHKVFEAPRAQLIVTKKYCYECSVEQKHSLRKRRNQEKETGF